MKNKILQIYFKTDSSDFALKVQSFVSRYNGSNTSSELNSVVIDYNKSTGWHAYKPIYNLDRLLREGAILTFEYLSGLPIGFCFENDGKPLVDIISEDYMCRITEDEDYDHNLHILAHIPVSDIQSVEGINYIINSIPSHFSQNIKLHLILYASSLTKELENDAKREPIRENIHNILRRRQKENKIALGRVFYVSNFDEHGISLNLNKNLDAFIGSVLIYLINDYSSLSVTRINQDLITTLGVLPVVCDFYQIVNDKFVSILSELLKAFTGYVSNRSLVSNCFSDFIKKARLIVHGSDNFPVSCDNKISEFIELSLDEILKSPNLSLEEKKAICDKFKHIWQYDSENIEDHVGEESFDDIYLDLLEIIGIKNNYPEINNLIKEIRSRKNEINQKKLKLSKLLQKLPPLEQNCFFEGDTFSIGDNKFKLLSRDVVSTNNGDFERYIPRENTKLNKVNISSNFSGIKCQGNQGSCVSFSLVSVVEYYLNTLLDKKDYSEAFLYYTARELKHQTDVDSGVALETGVESLQINGVCTENLCPYDETQYKVKPSHEAYQDALNRRIVGGLKVENDIDTIKTALANGHPVIGSFRVFKSLEKNNDGFVTMPEESEWEEVEQYHAMVICGYDDVGKYFVVRNSWGEHFGLSGYCYLPYSYIRNKELTRTLFILNMKEIPHEYNSLSNAKEETVFSERFNYAIENNKVQEEILSLSQDRDTLNKKIKELQELIDKISHGDYRELIIPYEESLKDIDQDIKNKHHELNLMQRSANRRSILCWCFVSVLTVAALIGLLLNFETLTSAEKAMLISVPILSAFACVGVNRCNKKAMSKFQEQIYALENERDRRNKEIQKIKETLPKITSILNSIKESEPVIEDRETDISSLYDYFKKILQFLNNPKNQSRLTSSEIKNELINLNNYISSDSKNGFVNYQKDLWNRIENSEKSSVYDKLRDEKERLIFYEQFRKLRVTSKVRNPFEGSLLVLIANYKHPNFKKEELDCGYNDIDIDGNNIIIGVVEKNILIDDIEIMSL